MYANRKFWVAIFTVSVFALSGCARYHPSQMASSNSYTASHYGEMMSYYGYGNYTHCGTVGASYCAGGINWVAVPTYHQVIVPTLREAPPTYQITQPYVPPATIAEPLPAPEPQVIIEEEEREVVLPPVVMEDAAPSYPEPETYEPYRSVIRK